MFCVIFNLCNIRDHFNICIQCTANRFQFHLLLALVPIRSSSGIWKSLCQSLPLSHRSKDKHNKIKVFVWRMFIRILPSPYICLERMALLDARLPTMLWCDSLSEPLSSLAGLYHPFMSFLHTALAFVARQGALIILEVWKLSVTELHTGRGVRRGGWNWIHTHPVAQRALWIMVLLYLRLDHALDKCKSLFSRKKNQLH